MQKTTLQYGLEYELFIQSIIKSRYKNTWLWNELPKSVLLEIGCINNTEDTCDDIGCDIVCQYEDDSYEFIQCKNYSTTGFDNTINICDLSGFYNFIAETAFKGIVYYSGKLSQQILIRKKKIKYINIPHFKDNEILNFTPRDYQIEAYNYLKEANRSVLNMPCGTGKTFVSFLLSLDYTNIIIFTPLISTTEQILNHYKNYYSNYENVNYTLINCNATRKVNDIVFKKINVIASTYDSSDIINKLLDSNVNINIMNTLIIIDEYHNLSNNMITDNNNHMNQILLSNYKILFVSATPKVYKGMDNIFGNVKYELKWDEAIQNKYICDYNFYYPNNNKIIEKIDEIKFDKSLVEKTILINKSYFLLESIKITNVKKCIVYLKSIHESTEFVKILKTINIYFNINIKIYEINYKTSSTNRMKYMQKFKIDNSCINIICNVHILDEGIDIPECDSIFLTHPNNDPLNLIQRISRANRLDIKNKDKIAKIFLWSKDKLKLESIVSKINNVFVLKYGIEHNDIINKTPNTILMDNINNNIDLLELLKKQTDIDTDFIDTFFSKFKIGSELNFDIKDESIAKYLDITLKNLRQRLLNEYSKNNNFIVTVDFIKVKTGKTSGISYMCNYNCFEKIVMSGNSEKSELVRIYFYKIRKCLVENLKKNDVLKDQL
jgi:superfamily II DNA or RNA helicase